jgi:hypothetical protein
MKKIIGRREKITLPDWGLQDVTAKIDTGAYTSSIHCIQAEERIENGLSVLCFKVLYPGHKKFNDHWLYSNDFSQKKVKNSFGQEEIRYKVSTKVIMFGELIDMEFTLTDRSKMRFPILLGRKVLSGRFLVDVQKVNLSKYSKK